MRWRIPNPVLQGSRVADYTIKVGGQEVNLVFWGGDKVTFALGRGSITRVRDDLLLVRHQVFVGQRQTATRWQKEIAFSFAFPGQGRRWIISPVERSGWTIPLTDLGGWLVPYVLFSYKNVPELWLSLCGIDWTPVGRVDNRTDLEFVMQARGYCPWDAVIGYGLRRGLTGRPWVGLH